MMRAAFQSRPSGANRSPSAWLRSRDLINLGNIALTGNASTLTHLWLDAASISNQGGFAIDNDSTDNLRIDCVTTDCGSMTNAAGATLTLNDQNGIIAIGSELRMMTERAGEIVRTVQPEGAHKELVKY